MSIENSPKWVQEQVKTGLEIKNIDIKGSIDNLSKDTLISFFENNNNIKFSKEGPNNSAAHIIAYQKALNLLDIKVDTDGMFGPKTREALKKFQIQKELKGQNGIPGPETIGALKKALEGLSDKKEIISSVLPEKKPFEKAEEYILQTEKFIKNKDGSYTNPENDYTITISKNPNTGYSVDRTRHIKRAFGDWEDNTADKLILATIQLLLSGKTIQ